jgi:hypothetical protein
MLSLRSVIRAHAGIQVCSGRISLDTRFRGYDGTTQPLVILIFAQIFFEGAREGLGQLDQRNRLKRLAIISLALLVSTVAARADRVACRSRRSMYLFCRKIQNAQSQSSGRRLDGVFRAMF